MKKLLFLALFLGTFNSEAQNIFRCNNDPSVPVSATLKRTLQEAHDAASNGDIIYVEPSFGGASYGNLNSTKTLTIIGNGYDHSINPSANQNWDTRASIVGSIDITGTTGSGTTLMGLNFNTAYITIKVPNVTIKRCKNFTASFYCENGKYPSGAIISQNFNSNIYCYGYYKISNSPTLGTCYTAIPVDNFVIKNNINLQLYGSVILSGCSLGTIVSVPGIINFDIANNVFYAGSSINYCMNCTIQNNIFRNIPVAGIIGNLGTGSAIGNNVCGTNPCVQGSNNVNSVAENSLFVVTSPSYDKDYMLKAGSPAIGAGIGGIDAGAFSTSTPYVLSGLAPVPQITSYSFNSSAGVYTISTPMTITLSIRGNN